MNDGAGMAGRPGGRSAGVQSDITGEMSPWLTLLDLAPARIWLLDGEHLVRWANRAACAIFGLPLADVVGRDPGVFAMARAPDDMPARLAALSGSIAHWSG